MGEMRDSDWSRENVLRSDWSVPKGAIMTTLSNHLNFRDSGLIRIISSFLKRESLQVSL